MVVGSVVVGCNDRSVCGSAWSGSRKGSILELSHAVPMAGRARVCGERDKRSGGMENGFIIL